MGATLTPIRVAFLIIPALLVLTALDLLVKMNTSKSTPLYGAESMAIAVDKLFDLAAWTRQTEYKKGGYVSLTEPLPDYPLYNMLIQREVIRSTPTIRYQLATEAANSYETVQVGDPIQVAIPKTANAVSLVWSKKRTAIAWFADEEAFNNVGSADDIIDVVAQRKTEHDAECRRNLEVELANASSHPTKNDLMGIKDWVPASASATDLVLNGGGNISAKEYTGPTVADVPRFNNAVCGHSKLSDDDLFKKISNFYHTVKYYVPEGARTIDSGEPNRVILCNVPTFLAWEELQVVANDDPKNDLGIWRGAINFRSTPVKINHAQSDSDSAATPSDHSLVYALDLNTLKMWIHADYNFKLSPPILDPNVPGQVKMWRELYVQLACINREKNLVSYSTATEFLA